MLFRRLSDTLPPPLQWRGREALEALNGLNAHEQLELACRTVLGILMAARSRFEKSGEDRGAYDTLCDAVEDWLRADIAPLRFARPH